MNVCFDDDVQRCNFASLNLSEDVFQLHTTLNTCITTLIQRAITLFTRFSNSAGSLFVWCRTELVSGSWHCTETKHLNWSGWTGFFDLLTLVVNERTYFAPCSASNDWIANF